MHKDFTIRAAKAGKHVYVEKPMAMNSEECREMIAACKEAGVKLGVAYRLQYEPHHKEMIRFAKEKTFGDIRHINSGFGFRMKGSKGWRLKKDLGGGALRDVGVYAIQGTRYIFGEEPVTVSALETKTPHFREGARRLKFKKSRTQFAISSLVCSGVSALASICLGAAAWRCELGAKRPSTCAPCSLVSAS